MVVIVWINWHHVITILCETCAFQKQFFIFSLYTLEQYVSKILLKVLRAKKYFPPKSEFFDSFGTNLESNYPLIVPHFILCVTFNFLTWHKRHFSFCGKIFLKVKCRFFMIMVKEKGFLSLFCFMPLVAFYTLENIK